MDVAYEEFKERFGLEGDKLESRRWSLGGSWGDCWGNSGTVRADEEPASFRELEEILSEFSPFLREAQRRRIYRQSVRVESEREGDYYGGSVAYARFACDLLSFYRELSSLSDSDSPEAAEKEGFESYENFKERCGIRGELLASSKWSLGGSWRDCWGNWGSVSPQEAPESFREFDEVLEAAAPGISRRDYLSLFEACVKKRSENESDYYGGSVAYAWYECAAKNLFEALIDANLVESAE